MQNVQAGRREEKTAPSSTEWKFLLILIVCLLSLLLGGAASLSAAEYDCETTNIEEWEENFSFLDSVLDNSTVGTSEKRADLLAALTEGVGAPSGAHRNWRFGSAFVFTCTVVTTIGYGSFAPQTSFGQYLVIIIGLFGIPLTAVTVARLWQLLWMLLKKPLKPLGCLLCYSHWPDSWKKWDTFGTYEAVRDFKTAVKVAERNNRIAFHDLAFACVFFLVTVPVGALLFSTSDMDSTDGKPDVWNAREALYFSFVTLSTVGLGDFAPRPPNRFVELLVVLYIFSGLSIMVYIFTVVQSKLDKSRILWELRQLESLTSTWDEVYVRFDSNGAVVAMTSPPTMSIQEHLQQYADGINVAMPMSGVILP